MKGILVFDNLNDVIYLNCCTEFIQHVTKLAKAQGLVSSEHATPYGTGKKAVDPNILVQLFSPLVTSQRFMREQFGNPYTSVQCEDGTNIVFQDFMGFLFLRIGNDEISYLKRALGVTITIVSYICGPDVSILKSSKFHSNLVDRLISTWNTLYSSDQSFLIEAVEQMNLNPQLNASLIKALQQIASKIQSQFGNQVHVMLFMETKLLSWYSTRSAINLGSEDLLLILLLCQKTWRRGGLSKYRSFLKKTSTPTNKSFFSSSDLEFDERTTGIRSSLSSSENDSRGGAHTSHEDEDPDSTGLSDTGEWDIINEEPTSSDSIVKYLILLKSDRDTFVPQIVHVGMVQDGLYFVLISEPSSSALITTSCYALQQGIEFHGKTREPVTDKQLYDQLDSASKKLQDLLKKQKCLNLRNEIGTRWDRFKAGFQLYLKSKDSISVQTSPMIDIYREVFRSYFNEKMLQIEEDKPQLLDSIWRQIKSDTDDFWGFLKVKANQNLSMECTDSLSINKYLEEFPGLVHFIYIDRNKHTVIMPTMDFSREETVRLTKSKIWGMVKFARDHMQQGHFSLMWKDSAFNYAYFLWFEDTSGTPMRTKQPAMPWESYPLPGILCGDFYKRVMVECFPSMHQSKIRCLELFCIHLGLATSSCVLEHSKRLATNIHDEFVGGGNPTADLL